MSKGNINIIYCNINNCYARYVIYDLCENVLSLTQRVCGPRIKNHFLRHAFWIFINNIIKQDEIF